jgi:cytochrome c-type biogenesis protein CcmH
MTLWFVLALMTAAAIFAVLWPLARHGTGARTGSEINVYRDQLDEIERDRAADLIGAAEAEAARIEVSRRLLASADAPRPLAASPIWRRRAVALVALVALPTATVSLYLALGSPSLPGQPIAARVNLPAADTPLESLIAQVEARLAQVPTDGRGWEVLAPVYLRLGRSNDAVAAWRKVIAYSGETAARQANLGEALIAAANGVVTGEAMDAIRRALALDPTDVKARYFLGLAAEQDGRVDEAAAIWRELLVGAPADAPWADFVRDALRRVAQESGPDADDFAAAAQLDDRQRGEMIRGMVERLAERMRRDGGNLDGWARLVRSYIVLGERDKARAAAGDARRALAGEPEKLRRLDEIIKGLGLEG